MVAFLFGFALGATAAVVAQANLRRRGEVDRQLAELQERVNAMVHRSRELLAETRAEVETLRQRITRGAAAGSASAGAASASEGPPAAS